LHNPVASTSESHVDSTLSTSGSEAHGQKGKIKFPCKLCEGDHTVHHCPFLDEAKRVLEDRPVSPIRLPPGYKKLSLSPPLVENLAGPLKWSAEVSIVDNELSESIPDESQKVEMAVDPVLPSEVPSSEDTFTEENEDSTVQILFMNADSNDQGNSLPIPLPQEGSSSESYPAVYSVPPPSNLVDSFDWNQLGRPCLPESIPF